MFQRIVSCTNFRLYGFFDRSASDWVRGISLIAAPINPLRYFYKGAEYTSVKFKISQLFPTALLRKAEHAGPDDELPDTEELDANDEATTTEPGAREFDLTNGPSLLDLDPEEVAYCDEMTTSDRTQLTPLPNLALPPICGKRESQLGSSSGCHSPLLTRESS